MGEVILADGDPAGNVASLDGLRGVAVALVLLHHLNYTYPVQQLPYNAPSRIFAFAVRNGWVGVDVFFVLSGYLITTILLRTRGALNFYQGFYVRRALRVWPLHCAVLLFVFELCRWSEYRHAAVWLKGLYWLGLSNFYSAFRPWTLPIISLLWSLAIEEQFYLVWPKLVRRLSLRRLMFVLSGALALELIARATPWVRHSDGNVAYRLTPLHWDGLVFGAMLSICIAQGLLTRSNARALLGVAVAAAALSILLLHMNAEVYCTPMIAFTTAAFLGFLVLGTRQDFLSRLFSLPLLRLIGRYSYFMYITQAIFFHILFRNVWSHLSDVFNDTRTLAYLVPTIGSFAVLFCFGHLSWRVFEGPLNRLKSRFPYRYPPVPLPENESRRGPLRVASAGVSQAGVDVNCAFE